MSHKRQDCSNRTEGGNSRGKRRQRSVSDWPIHRAQNAPVGVAHSDRGNEYCGGCNRLADSPPEPRTPQYHLQRCESDDLQDLLTALLDGGVVNRHPSTPQPIKLRPANIISEAFLLLQKNDKIDKIDYTMSLRAPLGAWQSPYQQEIASSLHSSQ